MIAEIISIGNELLSGKVTDTNSSFLAKELSGLGIECKYKSTCGDNKKDIEEIIQIALTRSNILIVTGGLGPTHDDITVESITSVFGVKLEFIQEIADNIKHLFSLRNIDMPESNLKQAYIPVGANIIMNSRGTAPGIVWDVTNLNNSKELKLLVIFPGVPEEMKYLWNEKAKDILKSYSTKNIYEKYINVFGISESALMETLSDYIDINDTKILPYANNFQIQLRVFSENYDLSIAKANVDNTLMLIRDKIDKYIYGYDNDTLEYSVAKLLFAKNKTVAVAESCTGGLVSSRLTDISGSSKFTKLNVVTYANKCKTNILDIPEKLIKTHGAVSDIVAVAMAKGIKELANTDIGIGITGIAGPTGGSEEKPVGLVYIALANNKDCKVYMKNVNPDFERKQIKWCFSQIALDILRQSLI